MKLSVITICYNEKNIRRTCESIKNQTFKDFQWIVIDGKSNKKILNIINEYRQYIDIFVSEKDKGVYDAMNKGISYAKGKYISFMNAGDTFYNYTILEEIFKNKSYNYDIIYGNANIINGQGKQHIEYPPKYITKSFFIYGGLNHQATFIKKSLFTKYGNYDLKYKITSDYEKFLKFISLGASFQYINKVIVNYYTDGLSANLVNTDKEREIIKTKYFSKQEINEFYNTKNKISFLGINIVSIKQIHPKIYIKFFDLFPIAKIKNKKVYLCGLNFLPIFKIKGRENE